MIAMKNEIETDEGCIYGEDCPLLAENPPFSAKALAAMKEAKDLAEGKIPGKWYHSIDDLQEALKL